MDRRKAGGIANRDSSKCASFLFVFKLLYGNNLDEKIN